MGTKLTKVEKILDIIVAFYAFLTPFGFKTTLNYWPKKSKYARSIVVPFRIKITHGYRSKDLKNCSILWTRFWEKNDFEGGGARDLGLEY